MPRNVQCRFAPAGDDWSTSQMRGGGGEGWGRKEMSSSALLLLLAVSSQWTISCSIADPIPEIDQQRSALHRWRQRIKVDSPANPGIEIIQPATESVLQNQSVHVHFRVRDFPRWGSVEVYLDEEWQAAAWEAESHLQLCGKHGHHVLRVVVHPPGLRTTQEGLDEEPSGIAEAAAAFEIAESAAPCPEKKSEGHCMWPWGVWDNTTVREDIPFGIRSDRGWVRPEESAVWFVEPIPGQTLTTEQMAFVIGAAMPLSVRILVADFEIRVAVGPDRTRTVYLPLPDGSHLARIRLEQEDRETDGPSIWFSLNRSPPPPQPFLVLDAAPSTVAAGWGEEDGDRCAAASLDCRGREGGSGRGGERGEGYGGRGGEEDDGQGGGGGGEGERGGGGGGGGRSVAFIIAGYVATASEQSSYGQRFAVTPTLELSVQKLKALHPGCHILLVLNRYSGAEPSVASALRKHLRIAVLENFVQTSDSGYELGALRAAFDQGGLRGYSTYVLLQHTAWLEKALPLHVLRQCPFAALAPSHLPHLCSSWPSLSAFVEYEGMHVRQRDLLFDVMARLQLPPAEWQPFCGALGNSFVARGDVLEELVARGFPGLNFTSKDLSFFGERLVGAVARSYGCEPCETSVDRLRVHINYGGCSDMPAQTLASDQPLAANDAWTRAQRMEAARREQLDASGRAMVAGVVGGACGSGEKGILVKFFAGRH